jgi:uncharacterized membrane protein HdeD (DUF308 family)
MQVPGLLKTEGVVALLLGVAAIFLPFFFTFAIELLVGALLFVGGGVTVYRGLRGESMPGRGWTLGAGVLTSLAGLLLLLFPAQGVLTLTVILVVVFLIQGMAEITAALQNRNRRSWVWLLVSGIASFVVALILLFGLPGTANWAIGLLVGINLLFTGFSLWTLGSELQQRTDET